MFVTTCVSTHACWRKIAYVWFHTVTILFTSTFPKDVYTYIYIYIALQIHIFPVTVLIHSWDTRIWTPSRHPILLKFSFHQNGQQKEQKHPRPEWTKAAPEVGMRTRTRAGWRGQATRTGGSTWLRGASDTGQKFEFTLEKNSPLKSWIMQCIVGFFCQWLIFIKQKNDGMVKDSVADSNQGSEEVTRIL